MKYGVIISFPSSVDKSGPHQPVRVKASIAGFVGGTPISS